MGKTKNNHSDLLSPDVREALKSLGFTDYYITIYIQLLKGGEMNAHDLSKHTGVPYSRIYEVLNEMIKRAIISKIDGRPSTFVANDPTDVFQEIKHSQDTEFEDHKNTSLPILNELFGNKKAAKNIGITFYQGDQTCLDHVKNLINATARSLQLAFKDFEILFSKIEMNLDFMRTKGVDVQIVIEHKYHNHKITERLPKYGQVRLVDRIYQNVFVSDEKVAFECTKGHFNFAKPSEEECALMSSTETMFITYISEVFQNYWQDGHSVSP